MSFQAYVDHVEAKTGKPIGELVKMARDKGLADEAGLAPGVKAARLSVGLRPILVSAMGTPYP